MKIVGAERDRCEANAVALYRYRRGKRSQGQGHSALGVMTEAP